MPTSKAAPVKKKRVGKRRLDDSSSDESDLSSNKLDHQRATISVSVIPSALLLFPGLPTLPSCCTKLLVSF